VTEDTRIIHGDCLKVLPTLAPGLINAIVTDPPYGTGEYVKIERSDGVKRGTHQQAEWDRWSLEWFEIALTLAPCCLVFCPEKTIDEMIRLVKDRGVVYRLLAWCKPNPLPCWSGQPGFGIDHIIACGEMQQSQDKNWIMAQTPRKGQREWCDHPHQKPLAVMEWLVKLACPIGGTVCDPFMGSCSTGLACQRTGRKFIGIENDPTYFALAESRLRGPATPLFDGVETVTTTLFQLDDERSE
jgi:site-specific DNA-methyltransferase (adenine-specific)